MRDDFDGVTAVEEMVLQPLEGSPLPLWEIAGRLATLLVAHITDVGTRWL